MSSPRPLSATPRAPPSASRWVWSGGAFWVARTISSPARSVREADLSGIAKDLGWDRPLEVRSLGESLFGFEVPASELPQVADRIIPTFRPFSRFPAVERDLSLLVDLGQTYQVLADTMRSALPSEALQDLRCVDVFRHKSLPEGRQAWLMRLRFQVDRTLVGEEIDGWVAAALAAAESLGASLRA